MFICFISVDRNEFMFDHMCANVLSKIQNIWDFFAMCNICIFALCNIYKSAFRRWNYLKAGRRRLLGSTPYCHQTGLSVRIQIWGGGWQRRNNPKLSRLQLFTRKTFQTKCAKPFLTTSVKARFCLSRHCQRMRNECVWPPTPPLTENQQMSPNRARNGVFVLNKARNGPKRP